MYWTTLKLQEKLGEKEEENNNLQRELEETKQRLTSLQGQFQEDIATSQELLRMKQQRNTELERRAKARDQEVTDLQGQVTERDHRVTDLQGQVTERDKQVTDLRREVTARDQQVTDLQGQLTATDRRVTYLHRQVTERDQQVADLQGQVTTIRDCVTGQDQTHSNENRLEIPCDWVINRDEIQTTNEELGRGAWGRVVRGKFRRCKVAVKQIHESILSSYNRHLFEREMNIASRCRHPCLLQFIGATNDEGSPLFVTELMESSLRALLELQPLSATDVSIILLDIAQALNYLHKSKPSPIIHRDISSANVLLWRQGVQWRGKVSDYGTANFMQNTMSVAPAAPSYRAPEAANPQNQTVKVSLIYFLL